MKSDFICSCAYQSLQMICSWFLNHKSEKWSGEFLFSNLDFVNVAPIDSNFMTINRSTIAFEKTVPTHHEIQKALVDMKVQNTEIWALEYT